MSSVLTKDIDVFFRWGSLRPEAVTREGSPIRMVFGRSRRWRS